MNNLIYFSIGGLKFYDPYLSSTKYTHNKWFNLPFSEAHWPPHVTSRVSKLDTPWNLSDTVSPIPAITHNEINFDYVIESIAEELCRKVNNSNKTPYICWSGGIDSTAILVSLLKVGSSEFLKKLVVLYNDTSIVENAYFYYNFIDKKIKTKNIDEFKITSDNYNKIILIDGEAGNQCMGQNAVQRLVYGQRYDLLDKSWQEIKDLTTLAVGSNDFSNQLVKESIKHAPIPIETGFDFLWWINFNFKFDDVLIRKMPQYTVNLTSAETKVFWEESLFRFFAHPNMQVWSLISKDLRREGLKITPKYIPKKYIYNFDNNDFWFYQKREEGSTSKVLCNITTMPYITSLVAIDQNWTKYKVADKNTRQLLGTLLQRN